MTLTMQEPYQHNRQPVIAVYPNGKVLRFRNKAECMLKLDISHKLLVELIESGDAYNRTYHKCLRGVTFDYAFTADDLDELGV